MGRQASLETSSCFIISYDSRSYAFEEDTGVDPDRRRNAKA